MLVDCVIAANVQYYFPYCQELILKSLPAFHRMSRISVVEALGRKLMTAFVKQFYVL